MKRLKIVLVLLVTISAMLSVSCTTNIEPIDPAVLNPITDPNVPADGAFKVDFGDKTFTTTEISAVISATSITIGAVKSSSGENFSIVLTGITPGEYSTTDKVTVLYKEKVADIFGYLSQNTLGSTATVNVTSIDNASKRIKGTFKFIGNWNDPADTTPPTAIQFTNGTFDLPFTTDVLNPTSSFFKVDFNGQTFNATNKTAVIGNGKIEIAGVRGANSESVGFVLQGTTTGTYTTGAVVAYTENAANVYTFASIKVEGASVVNTATVTITNINTTTKIITGTFNFVGHWSDLSNPMPPNPIDFTNGSFSLPYTDATTNPVNGSFKVDIDGVPFVATQVEAVKSFSKDPITNEPVLDPNTNLPLFIYTITGTYNQTSLVSLNITGSTAIDSVNMPGNGAQMQYLPNMLNPSNPFESYNNQGNITFTNNDAINKIFSGTFNCKLDILNFVTGEITSSKQLTNGVFTNVTYTIQ